MQRQAGCVNYFQKASCFSSKSEIEKISTQMLLGWIDFSLSPFSGPVMDTLDTLDYTVVSHALYIPAMTDGLASSIRLKSSSFQIPRRN